MALRGAADALGRPGTDIMGAGVRFTAPVYPGETLETVVWREGEGARFRTHVIERDVVVLDQGSILLP
jgi:acyl dehydratase